MEHNRKDEYLQNSWPLQLFISENVIYMYLEGRKRMPRGAAEIGQPLRLEKGATNNMVARQLYNWTNSSVVRLWNYFSSSLSLWPLQKGNEELWGEFSVLLSETLAVICRLWGALYRRWHACLGIHVSCDIVYTSAACTRLSNHM